MSNAILAPVGGELIHLLPKKGPPMAGHTTMPPRTQSTPHGDVTLTSRWMRDRYLLVASGSPAALRWLFPKHPNEFERISPAVSRHDFVPSGTPVTVCRDLARICARWQSHWNDRQYQEAAGTPAMPVQSVPTIGSLIEAYVGARQGELAASTLERNRHYLNHWLQALGAATPLRDLTEDRILAARKTVVQGREPSTVNGSFAVLRTVLRWATARGWMTDQSYRGIRKLREARNARDKAWWTTGEVDIALRCAGEVDQYLKEGGQGTATLLIALGCLLGLRWEEIVMLRWQDLDLDATDPSTGMAAPVAHIVPKAGWMPKDGEARAVPMHTRLVEIIRPFRKAEGYLLMPVKAMPKRGGTKRVYRYDPKKVWNRVLAKAVAAGVKTITPHGMRHSFCSNLLISGVSDVLVARWLGHADTTMVHQHYGHLLAYHGDINRMVFSVSPAKG